MPYFRNFSLVLALVAGCLVSTGLHAQQATPKAATPKAATPKAATPKAKAAPKAPATPPATTTKPSTTPPATSPPSTTPPAAATPSADPSKPARAEYDRLFEEWKTVLKALRTLKVQYQSAAAADQPKIQEQWDAQIAKGNELLVQLEAAGIKAYEEAPNTDPQLGRFLVKLSSDHIDRDEYPAAKAITDALIANNCPEKSIYVSAAIAAHVLNDFDQAEEYFTLARDSGADSDYGRELAQSVFEYKKLWPAEQKIREAEAAQDDLPRVKLTTTKGDIVLELFENQAPDTVGNFISLVEGQDGKGFYDGLTFHRVLKNFMAQGGDPKADGTGGPGYNIFCECYQEDYRRHFAGTISMAHAGRDTGGSQFFLTFRPTPNLNGKHTAFGRVIEGMDVLAKLQRKNPDDPVAVESDKIITATVLRKRDHAYAPKKVE